MGTKTIKFSKDNETRLKKLKIKTMFVNEMKACEKRQGFSKEKLDTRLKYLTGNITFFYLILSAFDWSLSEKRGNYWNSISIRFPESRKDK